MEQDAPIPKLLGVGRNHCREGVILKGLPEERAVTLGLYIIEHNATVRQAAKVFHISKSTVHKDVTQRLKTIQPNLQEQVKSVLDKNKQERHIRGGLATRNKYASIREEKAEHHSDELYCQSGCPR